ncbi:MAG: type III-B CRISPR module-associated Cmr3 family protein [Myxococcota bacterium]
MTTVVRIDPVDVLYLRGNRLFAEGGDADPVMPPWPSLFAGALRSRMLMDHGAVERFRDGALDGRAAEVLGTGPEAPGTFRLAFTCLARGDDLLLPAPADVGVLGQPDAPQPHRLAPLPVAETGLRGSFALPAAPVLPSPRHEKPIGGCFLTARGLERWQSGAAPEPSDIVFAHELWQSDPRLGIALSPESGTAREGHLYTTRTVALREDVGFLVGIAGAEELLPKGGLLRLGGDGRAAAIRRVSGPPDPPWGKLPSGDRFTMTLVTPGIFEAGWLPTGAQIEGDRALWRWNDLEAEILAAAVPRAGVVSGWDLAHGRPKRARRVVPAGAVYWLRRRSGPMEALASVSRDGLWPSESRDPRRAEGFNNVWFGEWAGDGPAVEG